MTRKVDVWLGDLHQAFVLVPPEIGKAFKASSDKQIDVSDVEEDLKTCSLIFYHDTRHFAHSKYQDLICLNKPATNNYDSNVLSCYVESSSFPRLVIPQDISRHFGTNISLATLYLFGATHTIAVDETSDDEILFIYLKRHRNISRADIEC